MSELREWSQEELRAYLMEHGWKESDFRPGEIIPQGVKYIDFSAVLTPQDITRGQELAKRFGWNNPSTQNSTDPPPAAVNQK